VALSYAHGAVQWLSADAVNTTYPVTGLSFQPKAIRFYWVGLQSATDAVSDAVSSRRGVGFAVSTSSRRAIGTFSQDTPTAANCGDAARNDCVACTTDGAGASDGRLDISAIASDGFTLIVDDAAPANVTVFWEAWGGTGITVAVIGDIAEPASNGTQNYTVTGFTSDGANQVVMFAGCQSTAALNTDAADDAGLHVGFATGTASTDQITVVGNADDASPTMDTDGYCQTGQCISMVPIGGVGYGPVYPGLDSGDYEPSYCVPRHQGWRLEGGLIHHRRPDIQRNSDGVRTLVCADRYFADRAHDSAEHSEHCRCPGSDRAR
jgi:hypothetical protein